MTILRWTSGDRDKPTAKSLGHPPSVAGPSSASSFQSTRLTYQLSTSTHNRFGAPRGRDSGVQGKSPRDQAPPPTPSARHRYRFRSGFRSPKGGWRPVAKVVVRRRQNSKPASLAEAGRRIRHLTFPRHRTRAASGHEESTSCGPFSLISHSHSFSLPYA